MSDNLAAQWAKRNKIIEQKQSNGMGFRYQIIDEKEKAKPIQKTQPININQVNFSTTSSESSRAASPSFGSPSPRDTSPRIPTPRQPSPKVFTTQKKQQPFDVHKVFLVVLLISAVVTSALYYKFYFSDDYCDEINPLDGCKKCPQDGRCFGNILQCNEGTTEINGLCVDENDQIAKYAASAIPRLREHLRDETKDHSKIEIKRILGRITEEQYEAILDLAPDIVQDGDNVKLLRPTIYNSFLGLVVSLWVSFIVVGVFYLM